MSAPEENEELTIQEEYKLWRQNCHYMYDYISETALTWPSLTVQWHPESEKGDHTLTSRLLLGTHTSNEDVNYLKVASVTLPDFKGPSEAKLNSRLKVTKKYRHADAEINRARYMSQDATVVATISGSGLVSLYKTNSAGVVELKHHTSNGYGLNWSPRRKGYLATGSDDQTVAIWDTEKPVAPLLVVKHSDIVNDVKWHHFDENVFGSVSDDTNLLLWDVRAAEKPIKRAGKNGAINSLAFNNFSANLMVVGNADSTIDLFDLRRMDRKLHTLMGHSESITSMEWSPHRDGILASGSQDRRVLLWDLYKIGEEQQQDDLEDGAPEIFMMHAGHTSSVQDLSWHPEIDWCLASTSDDNVVHIWKVADKLTANCSKETEKEGEDGWEDEEEMADADLE
ncbi:hypothetical protein BABINDRAFT_164254 [Babjeviella inositovora NRRL Y-12698]|uniref:Histone-binding protein RBBP4-like N-terminal domain-containing protein n=1 Tax=Babjeviella inositovora NRRL Y-12698 TaxID=984486 RepID=A0A1E3QZE8_9ASCO|nr:uncharacterized protein BABINDRAFT_164254 [Babjeviella inositovora NRRL Y-12698]ODQ82467.1 hypothetical protein BABINDRAFT_164254 [Babjeviella inositovora NRRL Y-12698]